MHLLIIGGSGLVGWNLMNTARASGHQVTATYHRHAEPGLLPFEQLDWTGEVLTPAGIPYDAIVNCSAWSWVDGCENDPRRAFRDNCDLPAQLARAAHRTETPFVHFSSSYIFDGTLGPYSETDPPNPINVYGRSKLAGEEAVLEATQGAALVIRTMGVYGEEPQQKNFVYQVMRNLRDGKSMNVPSDQLGNATHAADIATGTLALLANQHTGIWNLAGPEPNLARLEFARRIAEAYRLDASLLHPVTTESLGQTAPRPLHGGLDIGKAAETIGFQPSRWTRVPEPQPPKPASTSPAAR